jgi:hypothetical protein
MATIDAELTVARLREQGHDAAALEVAQLALRGGATAEPAAPATSSLDDYIASTDPTLVIPRDFAEKLSVEDWGRLQSEAGDLYSRSLTQNFGEKAVA